MKKKKHQNCMKSNCPVHSAVKLIICFILVLLTAWLVYRNISVSIEIENTVDSIKDLNSDSQAVADILKGWDRERLARTVGTSVILVIYVIVFVCVRYVGPSVGGRKRISKEETDDYLKEIEQEYRDNGLIAEITDAFEDESEFTPDSIDEPEITSIEYSHKSVIIKWSEVNYAEGYIVYRKINNESWKKLGKTQAMNNSYEDYMLDSDTTYIYTVRAYLNTEEGRINSTIDPIGAEIHVKNGNLPGTPDIWLVSDDSGKKGIGWSPVEGAKSYRLYMKDNKDEFKIIEKIKSGTECRYLGLESGKCYTISAACSVNKHVVIGKYNTDGILIP